MAILNILIPLLFSLLQADNTALQLKQDLQKDLSRLQQRNSYFISDNSTDQPSVKSIANDLQLFALVANLDLSRTTHNTQQQGPHQIQQWTFSEGQIRRVVQVESIIALDTVVTQRYLENRPPTQHRVQNTFTFRTYFVSTDDAQHKLHYLTEAEQGLLAYTLGEKQVEVSYTSPKEGLTDILAKYKNEAKQLSLSL
ncbi:hypothetical protein [Pontibacter oryzae]|uniref:Uncharacterized protein n=1 Tax=Pontibacter oryzae TaxID=2304593 RepID=A0A399SLZ5_9BACT|nr:hypothetical protein [Pontibacter oryzae]RIJ42805.1 hypothetical protein D1627_02860 [Pontibacter oryzae]